MNNTDKFSAPVELPFNGMRQTVSKIFLKVNIYKINKIYIRWFSLDVLKRRIKQEEVYGRGGQRKGCFHLNRVAKSLLTYCLNSGSPTL